MNFEIKNKAKKFASYFWFVIVLKTIDAQMLFRSVFFKMHEEKVINFQKWPKRRFWQLITFFGAFSKILNKITIVCLLFLKLNQSRNTNK